MEKNPKHDKSALITDTENKKILDLVEEENGISLSTGIVELWLSDIKTNHNDWSKHSTGVLCLVRDSIRNSYYFRLYNLKPTMIWESELYKNFHLKKVTDNFYCFPSLDCNAGFNFAFTDEAKKLENSVNKIASNEEDKLPINDTNKLSSLSMLAISMSPTKKIKNIPGIKIFKNVDKKSIGLPINFEHKTHVGITQDSKFDCKSYAKDDDTSNQILQSIQRLLNEMNLQPNKKNIRTVELLIEEKGGYEKFIDTVYKKKSPAPPIPVKLPFVDTTRSNSPLSPQAPPSSVKTDVSEKLGIHRQPPQVPQISPPIQKSLDDVTNQPENMPPSPPLPPPLPSASNLNPSIELSSNKNDLMSQIKLGTNLKAVNLNKKEETESKLSSEPKIDMVDQIKIALENMRQFIKSDDEDNDDDFYQKFD